MQEPSAKKKASKGWYVLLVIPFIGTLIPSVYASATPELWGFPFFYWYQLAWVIIGSLLTGIVYKATK